VLDVAGTRPWGSSSCGGLIAGSTCSRLPECVDSTAGHKPHLLDQEGVQKKDEMRPHAADARGPATAGKAHGVGGAHAYAAVGSKHTSAVGVNAPANDATATAKEKKKKNKKNKKHLEDGAGAGGASNVVAHQWATSTTTTDTVAGATGSKAVAHHVVDGDAVRKRKAGEEEQKQQAAQVSLACVARTSKRHIRRRRISC
jgi:hypothetical protein